MEGVTRNQFLGVEDVVNLNEFYTSSVFCEKATEVLAMCKSDFLKL